MRVADILILADNLNEKNWKLASYSDVLRAINTVVNV
jgi:hypothetical protein